MPRKVKSPVARWKGTVTLCDPLTIEQVMAIEDALDAATRVQPSDFLKKLKEDDGEVNTAELKWSSREDGLFIPVIMDCVEQWDLKNFTPDPFPGTPRRDSHLLVQTLWSELLSIYQGEREIPNE